MIILVTLLITSFLIFGCVEDDSTPIGGDLDENGCLIGAGYSFDENVGACTRNWELNDSQKVLAKEAVSSLDLDKNLTVVSVLEAECENCFVVEVSPGTISQENTLVKIQDFEVVQEFEEKQREIMYEDFIVDYNGEEQKLNYSITLFAPRACDSFEIVDELIMESYPVQIMVELQSLQPDMVCAQVITSVIVEGSIDVNHVPASLTIKLDEAVVVSTSKINSLEAPSEATYCTIEQKQAEVCTMEYAPVCGDNNVTYGNACEACKSSEVDYYIDGECQ